MPKHWVVREKSHDYGIDLEVEIFDKNDNATGLLFLVQMKSTSTKRKSVDIQITTVNYYKSLELPVAIFLYCESEDVFYWKWAYSIDMYYAKEEAQKENFASTK